MTMKTKILVFPFDTNPYQKFLYSHISDKNCEINFLYPFSKSATVNCLFFYPQVLAYRLKGFEIFHLHWPFFHFPLNNTLFRFLSLTNSICSLLFIKFLGYKLIWTVHNRIPHEKITANDELVTDLILNLSNKIIVHSYNNANELNIPKNYTNKISVIPLGNYKDAYPNEISQKEARSKLKIDKKNLVYIFFGKIRPYKGIDQLIEKIPVIFNKKKKITLIIAGQCTDGIILSKLRNFQITYPNNVILYNKYIPDDEVQIFFKAADLAIFPFKELTTSSSVLLALAFNIPIIAPLVGNIKDFPANIGFFYPTNDEDGLLNAIERSMLEFSSLARKKSSTQIFNNQFTWEKTAQATLDLYHKC